MRGWGWLTDTRYDRGFVLRVLLKAAALFVLVNLLFAACDPVPALGRLSVYGWLAPPRERLPYGESEASYNLSLYDLNAMFSSHAINHAPTDETRVLVIGDSSVWGVLLENRDTLPACLNRQGLALDGRPAHFYNLGYPTMSAFKDVMLLERALYTQPDRVIWLVTLESLPRAAQLDSPIVQNNAGPARALIDRFGLALDAADPRLVDDDVLARTLVGQRRALADWWRLQLYGIAWGQTGIDQVYPPYTPRTSDFDADLSWQGIAAPRPLTDDDLALDVLAAGVALAGARPLLLVNEPIFIADGLNSDLRYNLWYPRWAYDSYRERLAERAAAQGWTVLDAWDAVPPAEFTDSPVHLTPSGTALLCSRIADALAQEQPP